MELGFDDLSANSHIRVQQRVNAIFPSEENLMSLLVFKFLLL